jgi:hypothetical protein
VPSATGTEGSTSVSVPSTTGTEGSISVSEASTVKSGLKEKAGDGTRGFGNRKMEVPKRFQPKRLGTEVKPVLMTLPSLEQPSMM